MSNPTNEFTRLAISGAMTVAPGVYADARGHFSETFNRELYARHGIDADFLQDNESWSANAGTVRGLHCQTPPHAQAKLVWVARGRVLDVIVDARRGSPTYAQNSTLELDATSGRQVFVPRGCLHGFLTLEPDTVVCYKVDAGYAAEHAISVAWDDPDLGIDWGIAPDRVILSDKDRAAMSWKHFDSPFQFEG